MKQASDAPRQDRTGRFDPVTGHEARTREKSERIGGQDRFFGYGSTATVERVKALDRAERNAIGFLCGRTITKEAIAARWAIGLLDFAIREGREPSALEERRIIAKVRANDVDARDFVDKAWHGGSPAPLGDALRRLRAEMHARAEKLLAGTA